MDAKTKKGLQDSVPSDEDLEAAQEVLAWLEEMRQDEKEQLYRVRLRRERRMIPKTQALSLRQLDDFTHLHTPRGRTMNTDRVPDERLEERATKQVGLNSDEVSALVKEVKAARAAAAEVAAAAVAPEAEPWTREAAIRRFWDAHNTVGHENRHVEVLLREVLEHEGHVAPEGDEQEPWTRHAAMERFWGLHRKWAHLGPANYRRRECLENLLVEVLDNEGADNDVAPWREAVEECYEVLARKGMGEVNLSPFFLARKRMCGLLGRDEGSE